MNYSRTTIDLFNNFWLFELRIKLKQDIENRVLWRENYQEKLIETEKNFRANTHHSYFNEREPTLEFADACQEIKNATGNLDF